MNIQYIDGHLLKIHCRNTQLIQHSIITVNAPHFCHRRLLWRRWCNKWECLWDSFPNPRSFVMATLPCASCDRHQQRRSHRRRKRRRRHRSWTKQKKSVQRRCVSEAVGSIRVFFFFYHELDVYTAPSVTKTSEDLSLLEGLQTQV